MVSRVSNRAMTARRGARRLWALTVAVAVGGVAAVAALPSPAVAAGSSTIALDAPDNGTPPQIAYDPTTQTTYVAWSDPVNPGIDLCVLPANATACEGGAPVLLTDVNGYPGYSTLNHPGIGGLVVLPGGEAVVIGTPVSTGTVAWASPAGGAAFLSGNNGLQNGGNFISPVSLFYATGNAVALSSTDVGLLDDYFDYFSDSQIAGPESPAIPAPNSNQTTPAGEFPRKALETNGPEIAAEPAPAPAATGTDIVVGVGDNFGGPSVALPGCLNSAGTGFGVSVGKVDGTSNAAGTLNGEGLPAYQVLACSAQTPVLASGGQAGIGVLETEGSGVSGAGSDFTLDYRPFDATATGGTFGAPVELQDVTNVSLGGAIELDLSDDSGTGVYATWIDHQGLVLDYSSNGGAGWGGPVVVPAPAAGTQNDPVIVGTGGGNAEIAYDSNPGTGNQVFLQSVNYQALAIAPTTVATTQASGSATGADLTISAGSIGETDRATVSGTNASTATGTMSYGLFSSSTCAASSEVFHGGTAAVTAGVAAPSTGVTSALAPGEYYWQAVYSGNTTNAASASTCGSEVLTVVPASSVGGSGTSNGSTVTVTVTCASTPCTVTITITYTETLAADKASAARKKKHTKTITLASGTFKIKHAGKNQLAVKLTGKGKSLLKAHGGHLKASIVVSDHTPGGVEKTTGSLKITTAKHKHK